MGIIDVGAGAINRGSNYNTGATTTYVDLTNPANDTGGIDTFEIWYKSVGSDNVKMGTFSGGSGTFDDRDYETLGTVSAGSKQTFSGLDCDVEADDYIGFVTEVSSNIERDGSGGSGVYYKVGDYFGSGSTAGYSLLAGDKMSLYGSGETPPVITANQTQIIMAGM